MLGMLGCGVWWRKGCCRCVCGPGCSSDMDRIDRKRASSSKSGKKLDALGSPPWA